MGQIISSTVSHFSTDYDLETVTRFFRNKRAGVGSGVRELDQAIEQVCSAIPKFVHPPFLQNYSRHLHP